MSKHIFNQTCTICGSPFSQLAKKFLEYEQQRTKRTTKSERHQNERNNVYDLVVQTNANEYKRNDIKISDLVRQNLIKYRDQVMENMFRSLVKLSNDCSAMFYAQLVKIMEKNLNEDTPTLISARHIPVTNPKTTAIVNYEAKDEVTFNMGRVIDLKPIEFYNEEKIENFQELYNKNYPRPTFPPCIDTPKQTPAWLSPEINAAASAQTCKLETPESLICYQDFGHEPEPYIVDDLDDLRLATTTPVEHTTSTISTPTNPTPTSKTQYQRVDSEAVTDVNRLFLIIEYNKPSKN